MLSVSRLHSINNGLINKRQAAGGMRMRTAQTPKNLAWDLTQASDMESQLKEYTPL
jgi:hypothetical protein